MSEGLFISFEGPEGSGKSTQVKRLRDHLVSEGHEVVITREPGGTPTGELIRDILQHDRAGEPVAIETEVLLFAASRAQHVARVIRPALERGAWVICDRFVDSSLVYQGVGRGVGIDKVADLNAYAIGDAMPACTFLMDLDVSIGLERMARRNEETGTAPDRIEMEALTFHQSVRDGYLTLADRYSERIFKLDANSTPDNLEKLIWEKVQSLG